MPFFGGESAIVGRVQRTGLTTIRNIMIQACRLIATWSSTIKQVYPANTALHVALDTANAACAVLAEQADVSLPDGV